MAWSTTDFTTRLGKLFGYADSVKTEVADLYGTNLSSVFTTFATTSDLPAASNLSPLSLDANGLPSTIGVALYGQVLQSIQKFVVDYVQREVGVYDGTVVTALRAVRDSLIAATDTFDRVLTSTIAFTATSGNQGNGTVLVNANRPDGSADLRQEMFTEDIKVRALTAGTVANFGEATFQFTGLAAYSNTNTEWPNGSGCNISLRATSASVTASVGTPGVSLLANGDFEAWSTNTPRNFSIVTGTAGTQILRGTTPARGSYSLQYTGDGATLTTIWQQIASGSGAPASVQAEQHYAISFWARVGAATTGTVRIRLETAAGTIVQPGTGITLDLSTLTTSYTQHSVSFSIAKSNLPTTLYMAIRSTTAIASAGILYLDELILAPMHQLYPGGPVALVTVGTSDWAVNDSGNIAVASTTGSGTDGIFMKAFQRWLRPEAQGIYLPISATPTINDNLVTV
jgi:hypothetical protein